MNSGDFRTLPLKAFHEINGAAWITLQGHEVPAHYGSTRREYELLTKTAAVIDFSAMTIIRGTGRDRADYLNRRLSQKIVDMQPGMGRRACLLDAVGKLIYEGNVLAGEDEMLLVSTPFEGDRVAGEMGKFVFSEDCAFENISRSHALFALVGPAVCDIMMGAGIAPFRHDHGVETRTVANIPNVRMIKGSLAPEGFLLLVPLENAGQVMNWLVDQASSRGGGLCGFDAFHARRIERRDPWWGIDTDHTTIPLDAHLHEAIHTDKGCYPGQETIAKILNLGHPARQLVRVDFEEKDVPALGSELKTADGVTAGHLTSTAFSFARENAIGMGMVKWPMREEGTELMVDVGGKEMRGSVVGAA